MMIYVNKCIYIEIITKCYAGDLRNIVTLFQVHVFCTKRAINYVMMT